MRRAIGTVMMNSWHVITRARIVTGVLAVGGVLACGSDSTLAPHALQLNGATGFWHLTLNHGAVTLSTVAPYDTIRLVPTLRNATGSPLTGAVLDSVVTTYELRDVSDTSLTITTDGLVRARFAHDGSVVIVRTTVQRITRIDSVLFNVTDEPAPPQTASLTLALTSSTITRTAFGAFGASFTAHVLDDHEQDIPHVVVRFTVDTSRLHLLNPVGYTDGTVLPTLGVPPSRTMLIAEATVYGVTVRDSAPVTVTPPGFALLQAIFGTPKSTGTPVGHFEPVIDTVTIVTDENVGDVGALVRFQNATSIPIDVVWDDPAAVSSSNYTLFFCGAAEAGNIPAFVAPPATGGGNCGFVRRILGQVRLLSTPGTYHYHSALYGTEGTIVVLPPQ